MAQIAQRFGIDLKNALASDMELLADFFQRAAAAIVEAEAQLQNLALTLGQAIQHVFHLLLEQLMAGGIGGSPRGMIFDEITQVGGVFLANRRLQTDRLLAGLYDLAHL